MGHRAAVLNLLAAVAVIPLHSPTGQIIWVNPSKITSVREPLASNRGHFAKGTRCVVVMVNGDIAVHDTCAEVLKLLGKP